MARYAVGYSEHAVGPWLETDIITDVQVAENEALYNVAIIGIGDLDFGCAIVIASGCAFIRYRRVE